MKCTKESNDGLPAWYAAVMALITRTAVIQARVVPVIKEASERILWRIGLNMSEAIEIFLRRVITDERIPFEICALDTELLRTTNNAEERYQPTLRSASPVSNGQERRVSGQKRMEKAKKRLPLKRKSSH